MPNPNVFQQTIFNAAAATASVTASGRFATYPTCIVEIKTAGFSGTLDIQGAETSGIAAANVRYRTIQSAMLGYSTVTQLSYTTSTAVARYIITEPYAILSFVMTRSAGTITVTCTGWPFLIAQGNDNIRLTDGTYAATVANGNSDALNAGTLFGLETQAWSYGFNAATWDRLRTMAASGKEIGILRAGHLAFRGAPVLHRNGITAIDKVVPFVTGDLTSADNGAGTGSLLASTTYDFTVIPANSLGPCSVAATINTQATGASGLNTHSVRLTIPQKTGAEKYIIFFSDAAAPLWVAEVTEAQRAAGDFEVTAVGTVAAGGGNPAGTIDVNVAGTGIATSNAIIVPNNAYLPATPPAYDCTGFESVRVLVSLALTDLRTAPSLSLVPFIRNELTTTHWHQLAPLTLALLGAVGQSLKQEFILDTHDATNLVILVGTIAGQGAAASVWLSPCR